MIICPVDIMIQGKSWRRGIHLVCMHWRGGGVMKINAILRTQMHLLYIILYVKCIQLEGGGVQKLGKMCVHSKWMAPIK